MSEDINVTISETETIAAVVSDAQPINITLAVVAHSEIIDPADIDHNLLKNYEASRHKELEYDGDYKCFKIGD